MSVNGTETPLETPEAMKIDRRNMDMEPIKDFFNLLKKGRKPLKYLLKVDIAPYLDGLCEGIEDAKYVEIEHFEKFIKNPDETPGYVLLALGLALIIESVAIHKGEE